MTPSDPSTAYVWTWLPEAEEPVVAGRLDRLGDVVAHTYGRSYLDRPDAVPLFLPELPLERGTRHPLDGMHVAGCIADAGPDAWGQRIVLRRTLRGPAIEDAVAGVGLLTFLLESGSNRVGALDFQASPDRYVARGAEAPLEELLDAATRIDEGLPLSPELELALLHGSSLGGARPKATVTGDGIERIAKFSRRSDPYPVVKAEGVAMVLARRAGLDVADVQVVRCADSDVLLVDRFDRVPGTMRRRMVVSALTIERLDERWARHASYTALADEVRRRFTEPASTLRELFARIAFNICVGNTDDHARNHAAFWDGRRELLTLTPAFDICPQVRSGGEASQAMAYGRDGERRARLPALLACAAEYHLDGTEAAEIIERITATVEREWDDAADLARLTSAERDQLLGSSVLNPSIRYDA